MLRFLLIFGLILNISPFVRAQNLNRVKQVIDTLASPSMHGRGYVLQGDQIAADYLEAQFREIGLQPLDFINETYQQPFPMNINTFPGKVKLKIDRQRLEVGKDFIVNPISRGGRGRAKVLALDTNIFRSKSEQQAFLAENLKRKAIVLHDSLFSRILDLPQSLVDKIYSARAIIELQSRKLTASLSTTFFANPTFQIKHEDFPKEARRIKYRLDNEFIENYQSQNVIGFIEGSSEPDSFLVFSAHYDHLGRMGKTAYFPGANDNASGIAMLLELARHFSQAEHRPKYSIAFMAFGGEEAGLIGSKYYVEHPLFPLSRIKFLLNLDLVGTGDDGATVVNGKIFRREFALLAKINEEKKYLPSLNLRGFAANSDHYFFTENKVRSFFIYTLGGIKAYHDIYDRAETLPLTRFSELFQLLLDFTQKI